MNCLSSSNAPSYAAASSFRASRVISRRTSYLNGALISCRASEGNFANAAAACTLGVVKLLLATEDRFCCCYSSSKMRHSKPMSNTRGRPPVTSGKSPKRSKGRGNSRHVQMKEEEDDDEEEDEDEDEDVDEEDEEEEEEEEDDEDEGVDLDEDEDEEDEILLPLEKMRQWLEKKPRGFGIGKLYDTSIEDKLLEEISVSQIAQAANINKLKNTPDKPPVSKKLQTTAQQKASEESIGVRARVVNLPKKKNVHRDLKVAFKGVPGLIRIVPAVLGNSKTRDPICKGFAFVEFKTDKDAIKFVQTFSNLRIAFGKVQKEIKCEMVNMKPSISIKEKSVVNGIHAATPKAAITLDMEAKSGSASSEVDIILSDGEDNDTDDEEDEFEETREVEESSILSLSSDSDDDGVKSAEALLSSSAVVKQSKKKSEAAKSSRVVNKQTPKEGVQKKKKKKKVPNFQVKQAVPGSAKRLQIKEKAMLSGVFSKYGAKAAKET